MVEFVLAIQENVDVDLDGADTTVPKLAHPIHSVLLAVRNVIVKMQTVATMLTDNAFVLLVGEGLNANVLVYRDILELIVQNDVLVSLAVLATT